MPERAALVVVNFDSHALLETNIGGLDRAAAGVEVVVVDNFFSQAERHAVTGLCDREGWMLVPSPNVGFGAGVNVGVAAATRLGCDVFVLLNPDARATPETIATLISAVVTEPLTLVCPTIVREDGSPWFSGGIVLVDEGRTSTRPGIDVTAGGGWLTGACLATSRTLWEMTGGFDDDYFLYWEDVDLSWKVAAAGGSLSVLVEVSVVHDVGGTQTGVGKSPTYCFYNCRNRLVFAAKHLPAMVRWRWVLSSPRYGKSVVLRSGRRQFLRSAGPLGWAATRGTVAGIVFLLRNFLARNVPPNGAPISHE